MLRFLEFSSLTWFIVEQSDEEKDRTSFKETSIFKIIVDLVTKKIFLCLDFYNYRERKYFSAIRRKIVLKKKKRKRYYGCQNRNFTLWNKTEHVTV